MGEFEYADWAKNYLEASLNMRGYGMDLFCISSGRVVRY
jgi:hypothetical protein